jgi:S1-C subfamily serine protease
MIKLLESQKIKALLEKPKFLRNQMFKFSFWMVILTIFLSSLFGFLAGMIAVNYFHFNKLFIPLIQQVPGYKQLFSPEELKNLPQTLKTDERTIVEVVEKVSPSVVNIVATRDLPEFIFPLDFGFDFPEMRQERREVGFGSGFIVSADGLILTNRHVVEDERAEYTVVLLDGSRFPAKVIARDRIRDLALLRVQAEKLLPVVSLGNSDDLRLGQTVIAIGNVLGEFQNSVSVGVVSGLGRTITARGGGLVMRMEDVIQTDAAINPGNSGGPLLNSRGEVIGINTAMGIGVENIGFSIPINQAKKAIQEVKEHGRILHPFLGLRWVAINQRVQRENNLPVDYGAWVVRGPRGEPAIFPKSAAERAGIQENDIILELNNKKITLENSLGKIITKYNPGDKVILKILRNQREKIKEAILGEIED